MSEILSKFICVSGVETPPDFWMNISALFVILFISKVVLYYLLRQRIQPNKTFQMVQMIGIVIKNHFTT